MGLVDVHVHLVSKVVLDSYGPYGGSLEGFFRSPLVDRPVDEVLGEFDAAGVERLVVLGWDA